MQYHALGLLYLIREKDRMAITKMVQQLGAGGKGSSVIRNPMAICMLVRFARKVMDEDPKWVELDHSKFYADPPSSVQKQMHEYLEGLLRHKSDMVNIEAARAICEMRNVTTADLLRPVAGKSSA
jgi:coatomer protein complex subunit gamma